VLIPLTPPGWNIIPLADGRTIYPTRPPTPGSSSSRPSSPPSPYLRRHSRHPHHRHPPTCRLDGKSAKPTAARRTTLTSLLTTPNGPSLAVALVVLLLLADRLHQPRSGLPCLRSLQAVPQLWSAGRLHALRQDRVYGELRSGVSLPAGGASCPAAAAGCAPRGRAPVFPARSATVPERDPAAVGSGRSRRRSPRPPAGTRRVTFRPLSLRSPLNPPRLNRATAAGDNPTVRTAHPAPTVGSCADP
jgi:hypothetical protein